MLLGQRGRGFDELSEGFRQVGLAHLLAMSGLHLGVLAGFVLLALRSGGCPRRWHAWVVIATVLSYLLLVEARLPVLRAAVMTVVASLGMASGRKIRIGSLLSLSALLLLWWQPDQLLTPGFQLSYAVVLALIDIAPGCGAGGSGRATSTRQPSGRSAGSGCASAIATAWTAWLVSAPLTLVHFGLFSTLTVPLTVLALPLAAVLLTLGYLELLLCLILPSAARVLAPLLQGSADLLLALVELCEAVPASSVALPPPSAAWAGLALIAIWVWGRVEKRLVRRWLACAALLLILWLLWPVLPVHRRPLLRIDMLAVGDGSCYVLRSGGTTVLFDAGSGGDPDIGRRVIAPALRHLGVRSIDAVAISHANVDHYVGVLSLVEIFPVKEVLVTPQLLAVGEEADGFMVAYLLDHLAAEGVAVRSVHAGSQRHFGSTEWRWLYPAATDAPPAINDASMVIRVGAGRRCVLLCGDIEQDAMTTLAGRGLDCRADVLELPHHGSHSPLAERFVAAVNPQVVMQSTGRLRWQRDGWTAALEGVQRLVTARDGAGWIEIDGQGAISAGTWMKTQRD